MSSRLREWWIYSPVRAAWLRLRCVFGVHARYDGIMHCMICHAPPLPCETAACGHDWYDHLGPDEDKPGYACEKCRCPDFILHGRGTQKWNRRVMS